MLKLFRNIGQIEKPVIISGICVLLFSFALLMVSVFQFGIGVTNCVTNVAPFQKGEVFFHDPNHYEIHYVARMWGFEPAEVRVPAHAVVDIYLTSADVTHGFIIPGTVINMMAVPGAVNYNRVRFDQPGTYSVVCHEYCGAGHQNMAATIQVEEPGRPIATPLIPPETQAKINIPGLKVLQLKGCLACHSIDGTPGMGPTFKGLWGKEETMVDGSTVIVDQSYVRESVLDPPKKVVKGYQPIMPKLPVNDAELQEIISAIKALK